MHWIRRNALAATVAVSGAATGTLAAQERGGEWAAAVAYLCTPGQPTRKDAQYHR